MGLFGPSYRGLCDKGKRAILGGDFEKASELLMQAIQLDGAQPRAFGLLGWCYQGAADAFWRQGEHTNQREYLELATQALHEAIRRETDAESRAELWWQVGTCLRQLGRDDAESLREAEKAWPGFTAQRRQENLGMLEQAMLSQAREGSKPR